MHPHTYVHACTHTGPLIVLTILKTPLYFLGFWGGGVKEKNQYVLHTVYY